MKKLLIFNAGDGDIPIINAAHELGFYVIASGRDTSLPGYPMADEVAPHDYSDKEGMLALARALQVDAVVSNANDAGIKSAAYVAEQLGMPGFDSYATTCLLHDKDTMKRFFKEYGIPSPISEGFSDVASAEAWARTAAEYPYICKPVDMSAGRGMTVVRSEAEFPAGIRLAFETSRSGRFVIEPFIEGPAQSHSCFIIDGKVAAFYMTNEYMSRNNPYCVDGCCSPAEQMDVIAPQLNAAVEKMAAVLHLKNGLVHTQHIVRDGKPYILEVTRRHPGACYSTCATLCTGISWPEWYVRFQLGDDGGSFPVFHGQSGVRGRFMLMAPHNGVVDGVTVDPELRKYVFDEMPFWKPELEVSHYDTDIIGILFLEFPSYEDNLRLRPIMPDLVHVHFKA